MFLICDHFSCSPRVNHIGYPLPSEEFDLNFFHNFSLFCCSTFYFFPAFRSTLFLHQNYTWMSLFKFTLHFLYTASSFKPKVAFFAFFHTTPWIRWILAREKLKVTMVRILVWKLFDWWFSSWYSSKLSLLFFAFRFQHFWTVDPSSSVIDIFIWLFQSLTAIDLDWTKKANVASQQSFPQHFALFNSCNPVKLVSTKGSIFTSEIKAIVRLLHFQKSCKHWILWLALPFCFDFFSLV